MNRGIQDHSIVKCKNEDVVYINVNKRYNYDDATNPTGQVSARYQEQFNTDIIANPCDYFVSVERFSISVARIPLIIVEPVTPGSNTLVYTVTLSYMGFNAQENVIYVPDTGLDFRTNTNYYDIYTYAQLVSHFNTAYETAFSALGGLVALPMGSTPPYLQFDAVKQRFELISLIEFYDEALANPIEVWQNFKSEALFEGFEYKIFNSTSPTFPDGKNAQYRIYDRHINWYNPPDKVPSSPPLYYQMIQDFPVLNQWASFKSLILTTNTLPINREYISVDTSLPGSSSGSNIVSLGILKDFIPLLSEGQVAKTSVDYVADTPKLINILTNRPINKLDLEVSWQDNFGNIRPLTLGPLGQMSVKLGFYHRSLYDNCAECIKKN